MASMDAGDGTQGWKQSKYDIRLFFASRRPLGGPLPWSNLSHSSKVAALTEPARGVPNAARTPAFLLKR